MNNISTGYDCNLFFFSLANHFFLLANHHFFLSSFLLYSFSFTSQCKILRSNFIVAFMSYSLVHTKITILRKKKTEWDKSKCYCGCCWRLIFLSFSTEREKTIEEESNNNLSMKQQGNSERERTRFSPFLALTSTFLFKTLLGKKSWREKKKTLKRIDRTREEKNGYVLLLFRFERKERKWREIT